MERKNGAAALAVGILLVVLLGTPAVQAAESWQKALPSGHAFYAGGQRVELEAYNINGSNYVRLADIGRALDFNVYWDGAVRIEPDTPYTGRAPEKAAALANGQPITEANVLNRLYQLERDWPAGTVWGSRDTPGTNKNGAPNVVTGKLMRSYHISNTYGCGAYASMISSLIFGDAENPARKLTDNRTLRPGDIVFVVKPDGTVAHVAIALESPNREGRFHCTDGNNGGQITWPDDLDLRPYSLDGFGHGYRLEIWTRYPAAVPFTGDSAECWHSK